VVVCLDTVLSIVIPTLDEEAAVAATLESVRRSVPDGEIVVADGGSRDRTVELARRHPGVRVVTADGGRGPQMNAGAAAAAGDALLFLHADTRLPPDAGRLVAEALAEPGVVGGSFVLAFDASHPLLWLSSLPSRLNLPWATYGDQAFFCRREAFERAGGFPPHPLFEDVALQSHIRKLGRCVKIRRPVITSARRFLRVGILRQQLLNLALLTAYHLGVSPVRLAGWYGREPTRRRPRVVDASHPLA
jgi:rSAM/selenodomain-associated transferase 2